MANNFIQKVGKWREKTLQLKTVSQQPCSEGRGKNESGKAKYQGRKQIAVMSKTFQICIREDKGQNATKVKLKNGGNDLTKLSGCRNLWSQKAFSPC